MRNVRVVASVLLRPLQLLTYALAGLSVRDRRRWVFGSWSGKRFSDNAAALFRSAAAAGPPPSVTWISVRRSIVRELRAQGFDARLRWSPAGCWATLRAGVFVYDGYTNDVNHWLSNGAACVLLRHGVGMKRIDRGIDVPTHRLYKMFHGRWWERIFWRTVLPWHAVCPHLTLATSDEHAAQAVEYFGVPRERVLVTGFPRHDALLRPVDRPEPVPAAVQAIRSETRPTILYMPTFRDGFARHDFDWSSFDEAAGGADVKVFVKLHYVDAERGTEGEDELDRYANIAIVDPTVDPMWLYPEVDALVTDFSSAGFDFLLLRKPIIYFVPDYDSFITMRSLYYAFDDVTPGPKCRTFAELTASMAEAVRNGLGAHEEHHDRLLDRFYEHRDGRSSMRVLEALRERLLPADEVSAS